MMDGLNSTHQAPLGTVNLAIQSLVSSSPLNVRPAFEAEMAHFHQHFNRYLDERSREHTRSKQWNTFEPVNYRTMTRLKDLPQCSDASSTIRRLAVLKLNGGLGTTMGCCGPKSSIAVRDSRSFLSLVLDQMEHLNAMHGTQVPLLLMNSFSTDTETREMLTHYHGPTVVKMFSQWRFPRVDLEHLTLLPKNYHDPSVMWYPPGHGNIFQALGSSGLLQELSLQGVDTLFVSNVDNLAPDPDPRLLEYFQKKKLDIMIELTKKTPADIKGGTVVRQGNRLVLLENSQVTPEYMTQFRRQPTFNTNNVWVRISAIEKLLESQQLIQHIDLIRNIKTVNGRPVLQLETAIGASLVLFESSEAVLVPRSRFAPVKSTSDLLRVQSDLYVIENGYLQPNPQAATPVLPPTIILGSEFTNVQDYIQRFTTDSMPSLLELSVLNVLGDVRFGRNVQLSGYANVIAWPGQTLFVPDNTCIENCTLTSSSSGGGGSSSGGGSNSSSSSNTAVAHGNGR